VLDNFSLLFHVVFILAGLLTVLVSCLSARPTD
jgi:hypothetical protein